MTTTTIRDRAAGIIADVLAPHVPESLPHRPTWRADQAAALAEDLHIAGLLVGSPFRPPCGPTTRDAAAATLHARLNWPTAEQIADALDEAGLLRKERS